MKLNIAVIRGDGIGTEVTEQAILVLNKIAEKFNHEININEAWAGGEAYDKFGEPLPQQTIDICKKSDSVLLGAVGGYKWDNLPADKRPEKALLGLRKHLNLYANLRPATMMEALKEACPLRADIRDKGIDIMVVRELTGGIYFGERGISEAKDKAWDTELYSEEEVRRIAKTAFETAMKRRKHVTSIDKANVLESSRLWRRVVIETATQYPEVTLEHMYVDNAAMQLVRQPSQFDVIVTSNMFGDILSDEASQIVGSIGLLPSASLGDTKCGMYEPIHGSAPDIAGKNIANPIATILSAALMLRYSFSLEEEAVAIEKAVEKTLNKDFRTHDIFSEGQKLVATTEMGQHILKEL